MNVATAVPARIGLSGSRGASAPGAFAAFLASRVAVGDAGQDAVWHAAPERPDTDMGDAEAASRDRVLTAALGGDRDAFDAVVRRYQGQVFRIAGRFFRERAEVDDAAQETFLAVWRRRATYRGDAPFEHWLTRVCLRACYARLRKVGRTREDAGLEDDAPIVARDPGAPGAAVDVARLLAKLAPKDRFVLLLLYGEGWSTEEIAARVGWSRANVKVRAHRARAKLRRILEEDAP